MDHKTKNSTDFKQKFVEDEDFTEIHKHYLQKEIDFLDKQILEIQEEVQEILEKKSSDARSQSNYNQEYL